MSELAILMLGILIGLIIPYIVSDSDPKEEGEMNSLADRFMKAYRKTRENDEVFHELFREALDCAKKYNDMEKIRKLCNIVDKYKRIQF